MTPHHHASRDRRKPAFIAALVITLHDRFSIEHITLQPEQPQGRSTPVAIRLWPRRKKPYS